MNNEITALWVSISAATAGAILLSAFGLGGPALVIAGIAVGLLISIGAYYTAYEGIMGNEVGDYQKAVLYHYSNGFTSGAAIDALAIYNIRNEAIDMSAHYYADYYGGNSSYDIKHLNEGDNINNHWDAYRRFYATALLTLKLGEDFAKDFTDAHEYDLVKPGIVGSSNYDTRKKKLAVDMDLLNNNAGIYWAIMWRDKYRSVCMDIKSQYPEITELGDIPGASRTGFDPEFCYFLHHRVAYGFSYTYDPIVTFGDINGDGKYVQDDGEDKMILEGQEIKPCPRSDGLVYTNFGEKEHYEKHYGEGNFREAPYFKYPRYC
ncbi:MAG: hypothetical protein LBR37_03130 [Erysipelotrichaceae bacterium]|jgi:hypothetical protein|nr:hypothetical protein [Erysipelotrichaceae bacterium]